MKNVIHWTPASTPPIPEYPLSTIVPCEVTVELPDDPFKPGHPYREVFHGGWWCVPENCWYFNGQSAGDHFKVIAWTPAIQPFKG